MGKLTLGQKADRVLRFLMGMRNARVAAALASRGFGQEDIEEGWALLREVARGKFDFMSASNADPSVLLDIDQWENTWFPVVSATLQRRFPAIAERIFLNLSQTEGAGVILTVGTLLERLDALAKATDQDSKDAIEILVRRGLTDTVLEQARALLRVVGTPSSTGSVDLDAHRQDIETAEKQLWDWYLEWSQIARTTINDRQLLRALGFLTTSRATAPDETEDDETTNALQANTPSGIAPPLASETNAKAS